MVYIKKENVENLGFTLDITKNRVYSFIKEGKCHQTKIKRNNRGRGGNTGT